MTYEEFFKLFGKHAKKKKWVLNENKYLESKHKQLRSEDGECPICFLHNQLEYKGQAAFKLAYNLTKFAEKNKSKAEFIVEAVDTNSENLKSQKLKKIRQRLLKICKVKESSTSRGGS